MKRRLKSALLQVTALLIGWSVLCLIWEKFPLVIIAPIVAVTCLWNWITAPGSGPDHLSNLDWLMIFFLFQMLVFVLCMAVAGGGCKCRNGE